MDVYLGPYTVAEVVDKGRYRLQNQSGKKLKKLYNGVLLKEHFPSQPDADLQENSTQVQKPDENSKPSKPCMPKRARLRWEETTAKQLAHYLHLRRERYDL